MVYMTHKRIQGITYYYAEENDWKNGKSRRKWQKYLGPLPKTIAAIEGVHQKPQYTEIFEPARPTLYFTIADEINTIKILPGRLSHRRHQREVMYLVSQKKQNNLTFQRWMKFNNVF
jgi:hypothetical protein